MILKSSAQMSVHKMKINMTELPIIRFSLTQICCQEAKKSESDKKRVSLRSLIDVVFVAHLLLKSYSTQTQHLTKPSAAHIKNNKNVFALCVLVQK